MYIWIQQIEGVKFWSILETYSFAEVVNVINHTLLLDAEITWYFPSSPMAGFAFIACTTTSESTVLGLADLAWSLRFLPSQWNFFNDLITVLWTNAPSPFGQQIFLVVSATLWPNSNSYSISPRIKQRCTLIFTASKSVMKSNNALLSAHQQPRYYQTQRLSNMVWTASVTWYMRRYLAHCKTLQTFDPRIFDFIPFT